jgi:hypothetical protein
LKAAVSAKLSKSRANHQRRVAQPVANQPAPALAILGIIAQSGCQAAERGAIPVYGRFCGESRIPQCFREQWVTVALHPYYCIARA